MIYQCGLSFEMFSIIKTHHIFNTLNYINFHLHSHWMTSKLNCWRAPILICLSSVSRSICISDVERCLHADIQAVWATLPCRERGQWGGRKTNVIEEERTERMKLDGAEKLRGAEKVWQWERSAVWCHWKVLWIQRVIWFEYLGMTDEKRIFENY